MNLPSKLRSKIEQRATNDALRTLSSTKLGIDFSSNDYLGFAKSDALYEQVLDYLQTHNIKDNGAGGSRLLTGNHLLYNLLEEQLTTFYNSEMALVFNSGYAANLGLISAISLRGEVLLYDAYCHASIRDGLALGQGISFKFKHNDLTDVETLLKRHQVAKLDNANIYVITESIFSMDGDQPDLIALAKLCKAYDAKLIVDEAHAVGVFGSGLVPVLSLNELVFARVVTFGKAMGSHGAAVLGPAALKDYLINFARSFIYSTGLAPHCLATIICAHHQLESGNDTLALVENIDYFKEQITVLSLPFIKSDSAIHCIVIPGAKRVKKIAQQLNQEGFDLRPILSPTVPINTERLRFCIHSFNTKKELKAVLTLLKKLIIEIHE